MKKLLLIFASILFSTACSSAAVKVTSSPNFAVPASLTSTPASMAMVSLITDTPTPIPTQLILPTTTPTPAPTRFILPTTTFIIPLIGNLAPSEGDTNGIVPPVISNAGQIAIIVNKVLFVQTSIDVDEFRAIDHGIVDAEWSLDGSELY